MPGDRKSREVVELRNRIIGHATALHKSYSEFGWLLDTPDQQMVRDTIQKGRALPPEESDYAHLRDMMAQIESAASLLAVAMFKSPGEDAPRPGCAAEGGSGTDGHVDRPAQSTMHDIGSKRS